VLNTVVLLFFFSGASFSTYLIGFNMKYLGGNYYANRTIRLFSYVIGNFTTAPLIKFSSLRTAWIVSFLIAIIGSIPIIFIDELNHDNDTILLISIVMASFGLA